MTRTRIHYAHHNLGLYHRDPTAEVWYATAKRLTIPAQRVAYAGART